MLGDFLTRLLLLVFGYAYPAFECFKVVEKNKVDIDQLRFWCQYWILVAIISVGERVADIFISWLPMYGEAKLALFIYLWYPKTKGTSYIYGTFVRPLISQHEPEIDRKIMEWRTRSFDMAIYYWANFAHLGQAKFFEILHYVAGQSSRFNGGGGGATSKSNHQAQANQNTPGVGTVGSQVVANDKGMPVNVLNPSSNLAQVHLRSTIPEAPTAPPLSPRSPFSPRERLLQTRQRLRRQEAAAQ